MLLGLGMTGKQSVTVTVYAPAVVVAQWCWSQCVPQWWWLLSVVGRSWISVAGARKAVQLGSRRQLPLNPPSVSGSTLRREGQWRGEAHGAVLTGEHPAPHPLPPLRTTLLWFHPKLARELCVGIADHTFCSCVLITVH